MRDVGIGVIGAGGIAWGYHLPGFLAAEGVRAVAVADSAPGRAAETAEKFGFEVAYADYRPVLERSDVDAVAVFTTYHGKRQIILDAIAAGKHVFTQKPLAASAVEGTELVAAAASAGVALVPSFMHNYFPEARVTKQLLDEGAIGDVAFIRQRNATHNPYEGAVRLGGATWDIGPHGIAMIERLSNSRIVKVQAMMDGYARQALGQADAAPTGAGGWPIDTLAVMNYTLSDGRLVNHEVQWTAEAGTLAWSTEIFGSAGAILLRPHLQPGVAISRRDLDGDGPGEWEFPVVPEETKGWFHHQLFIDDVRSGRADSARAEDGLATLRVLEAVYESARTGAMVEVEATP